MLLKKSRRLGRCNLTFHNALVGVATALLVGAAVQDVIARTVSDRSTALLASIGMVLRYRDGWLIITICISIFVFLAALACWSRGWLGGGDVKLVGAAMLLVPPPQQTTVLFIMAMTGGVLSVLFLITRQWMQVKPVPRPAAFMRRAVRIELWRLGRGGPIPYAVAIAVGALGAMALEGMAE